MDFVLNVGKKKGVNLTICSNKMREVLKNMDFHPVSKDVNREDLLKLLTKEESDKLICFHKWVYWKFGEATKSHRCCEKCYKKQKSNSVLYKTHSRWVKDDTVTKLNLKK
ncbi:MAG: hypothetical protein SLAVMIC_00602 [uncultured marine phage]|uniref:Uncharacterized protein n=1 Tax=uncultured marine phage TaxID=707152 RepID=A0A8D9CCD9_9VIRU|nr:MAG: hypothetical protein SLAVMIC_00602 [uncultured marine phage]